MNTDTTHDLPEMSITSVLQFGGKPHLIFTFQDEQFISLRPLTDQIGLDWRRQKGNLLEDENVFFYGVLLLESGKIMQPHSRFLAFQPNISSNSSENQPETAISAQNFVNSEPQKPKVIGLYGLDFFQKDTIFIRVRRVYMYLARISIGHVRGTGKNENAAQYLLSLQEEWADALYEYETTGETRKQHYRSKQDADEKSFMRLSLLVGRKNKIENESDRKLLARLITRMSEEYGITGYQTDLMDDDGGAQ